LKNYRFIVTGKVQGVFYRKNVYKNSIKDGFSGYVKNLKDKSVEACVTCEDDKLESFIEILKKGSPKSVVKTIDKYECDEIFSGDFKIKYD